MDLISLVMILLGGYLLYGYMKAYDKLSDELIKMRMSVESLASSGGGGSGGKSIIKGVGIGSAAAEGPVSQMRQTFMNILKQMA